VLLSRLSIVNCPCWPADFAQAAAESLANFSATSRALRVASSIMAGFRSFSPVKRNSVLES
jgi:hypothetical protein